MIVNIGFAFELDGVLKAACRKLLMFDNTRVINLVICSEFEIEIALARMYACKAAVLLKVDGRLFGRDFYRAK